MLTLHTISWTIGLVLFFVAYMLYKLTTKKKLAMIFHMVLRVLFVLILISGSVLTYQWLNAGVVNPGPFVIKGIMGLALIGLMEVMLQGIKNKEVRKVRWLLFIAALGIVFFYGYVVIK
ncbi:hypothetical protein A374_14500 [Fictibacillus macauensis ZFHKF-1]|uniref:Uncharacterized protein n=1 Tax=Fictibacillus macauensis ZFHKF-1 TaxID=1196324 RepID=I8UCP2_9BACL|nr:DUF1516 family protein [Fictibacillus macauensis]EIT84548.1 hypothetical protein A374_14500 [Fictibacillus macauensis ZFHKF-1]